MVQEAANLLMSLYIMQSFVSVWLFYLECFWNSSILVDAVNSFYCWIMFPHVDIPHMDRLEFPVVMRKLLLTWLC
jgi:hypothetical protein